MRVILDDEMSLIPLLKNIKKLINNRMFQLRKIRKYINTHAAILIYKQTILPIFDYHGFLLISLNVGDKNDLQVMQNDALRYCNGLNLLDKISIPVLHNSIKFRTTQTETTVENNVYSVYKSTFTYGYKCKYQKSN